MVSNAQTVSIKGRDVVAASRRERYFVSNAESERFGAYALARPTVFTMDSLLAFIEGVKGRLNFSSNFVTIEF